MAKASARISVPKIKTSRSRGFTLIEVVIVLAIIGIIATFGGRSFINKNTRIKSAVRRFAVMIKKLRNRARIENRTYRLVFDLPKDDRQVQTYWVEASSKDAKLMSEEELEDLKKDLADAPDGKVTDPQGFTPAGGFGGNESGQTLPRGLFFDSIELAGEERAFKNGRIYIFFFPQGYVQESAIHITDKADLNWTLAIHPLTGKVEIIPRFMELKELIEED